MKRLQSPSDVIRTAGAVTLPYFESEGDVEDFIRNLPVDLDAYQKDQGRYLMLLGYLTYIDSTNTSYNYSVVVGEAMSKYVGDEGDANGRAYIELRDCKGLNHDTNAIEAIENAQGYVYLRNDGGSLYLADDLA